MGLVLLGPAVYAQTPNENSAPNQNEIQEDHNTKDLDKVLRDYNKDSEKVLKDAEKLVPKEGETTEVQEGLSEKELGDGKVVDPNDEEALEKAHMGMLNQKSVKKNPVPENLKKVKYADAIRVALASLQTLSEAELVKLLKENTKGSGAAQYFDRFPLLSTFAVRLIKDPEAMPRFVSIADDTDRLIRFGGLMVGTILVGVILKRIFRKEGRGIPAALGFWFLRFMILSSLRLFLLYSYYGKEIGPAMKIANKTFL